LGWYFYARNRPRILPAGVGRQAGQAIATIDKFFDDQARFVLQKFLSDSVESIGFLLLQGVETLALRVERHVENARKVAEYLRSHNMVEWVNYAGFPDNPLYPMAQKYLGCRRCSLLTFGVKGGFEAGTKCFNALR